MIRSTSLQLQQRHQVIRIIVCIKSMALSYCTTYQDSLQLLNSDMTTAMTSFQQFPFQDCLLPPDDLLAFDCTHSSYSPLDSYNFIDPFLPDDPFHYSPTLPHYSHQSFSTPEILEFDCSSQYPKRQRTIHTNSYQPHIEQPSDLFNWCVPNTIAEPLPELFSLQEIPPPLPLMELQIPAAHSVFDTGKVVGDDDDDQNVKKAGSGVSLSVQSIAARERRRKITEKTQKLAKLIPGGHKMNTAEMFQAASKYVKYLQAQVGVLQLLSSVPQEALEHGKELEVLLSSPTVHGKLYWKDKCLVPRKLVEALADDHHIQTMHSINEEIDKLLQIPTGSSHD